MQRQTTQEPPPHLGPLQLRLGDRLVDAPEIDQEVLRGYPRWPEKGEDVTGQRLTIMAQRRSFAPGEEVRVLHVHEVTIAGHDLFVMGPKPVYGEMVDGICATPLPAGVNPLHPAFYDGRVVPGPGIDVNFEITSYRFTEPGSTHRIAWNLGELVSNTLLIRITT